MSSLKTTSFLSKSLELTGTLRLEGGIRIDGQITGNIESTSTIFVGETAEINGNIISENLVSAGAIQGKVIALESVQIKRPGSLRGDVSASEIMIDKEVFFNGKCNLTESKAIHPPKAEPARIPTQAISKRK